jgi:antitoxin component YwqK of YwqJK toxin-antitoxin module
MKNFLLIAFLILSISTFGQKKSDYKIFYKSGKLELERKFDKSCNCDRVTEYYESGKIKSRYNYLHTGLVNIQRDGEDIIYYENGIIQLYYYWNNGSPSGRIYNNFPDGQLAYEKTFANKFKTGTWKYYNPDGTLKEECIFIVNKTSWESNDDYATNKFYFNNKLVYTVELVAGKRTNLQIIDKDNYDKLITSEFSIGQNLFIQNCRMCHNSNVDMVGPMMKGVVNRRTDEWLIKMIVNGDALIQSGDKDAVELYIKWNKSQHPNFERLSNEEVLAIIDFLKTLK